MSNAKPRAIVVGGSIGGLTAALVLDEAGFDVDLFERTPEWLEGRGSGIVVQPDTVRWMVEKHGDSILDGISTESSVIRHIGDGNTVVYEEPGTWRFTSWTSLYRTLLGDFDTDRYHLGEFAVGLDQDEDGVDLRFVSGRTERADLVVFADGISGTGRRRMLPDVAAQYAGYVGWRGTVSETDLEPQTVDLLDDALGYAVGENTLICMYSIPALDGSVEKGKRLFNYIWYRNIAPGVELDEFQVDKRGFPCPVSIHPGQVQDRYVDELKSSVYHEMPPAVAELVNRTEEPYVQVLYDVTIPQMAFGRVALIGDGAFAARPHAAAGTAKAAVDAWTLADAMRETGLDVVEGLRRWEPGQLALGKQLVERSASMGNRAQFANTWDPADPNLHFGLYGPDR